MNIADLALRAVVRPQTLAHSLALCAAVSLPVAAQPLTGGSFTVVGTVVSGSGISTGGSFSITGWAASAGAGKSNGGDYELACGLLGIYLVQNGTVTLKAELMDIGNVRLWWPAEVTGYELESSVTLGPGAIWQPVTPTPAGNTYTTGALLPARYFRLRQL